MLQQQSRNHSGLTQPVSHSAPCPAQVSRGLCSRASETEADGSAISSHASRTEAQRDENSGGLMSALKYPSLVVPVMAQWLMNPTRNHEVVGSGLWVRSLTLLSRLRILRCHEL